MVNDVVQLDLERLRRAQEAWSRRSVGDRLKVVLNFRHLLASHAGHAAGVLAGESGRSRHEKLTSEIMPLLAAARFLEREAPGILAPRRLGRRGRPLWLSGVTGTVRREPFGVVLIVGPSNYPFFLPAAQALQALTAGNAVVIKPGRGGFKPAALFTDFCARAGLPDGLLEVTSEEVGHVADLIHRGVDKVIFTGSTEAGREVVRLCGDRLVPVVAELSGDDPVVIRDDADIDLATRAIRFGDLLNDGQSCIAPRRIVAGPAAARRLEAEALGLPLHLAVNDDEAVRLANESEFALGAAVFSRDNAAAERIAERLQAGVVVINDLIVPTADPRAPFGGRKGSGFGTTRGPEGLLEMTVPKVVLANRSKWHPHFDEPSPGDEDMCIHYLNAAHGTGWGARLGAVTRLVKALMWREKS